MEAYFDADFRFLIFVLKISNFGPRGGVQSWSQSPKNQKRSKMVEKIWKNHQKFLKIYNFIKIGKKYFWGLFGPFLAPFGPFWGRKSRNSQKNLKKIIFGPFWYIFSPFLAHLGPKIKLVTDISSLPYFNILHYLNVTSFPCKEGATFRTYVSLNLKKFLSLFVDIAYLTLFLPGERHATPFVTHGHIPH